MISLLRRKRARTAAEWFAARQAGAARELESEFETWIAEHPSHAEEYALCEIAWGVSGPAARGASCSFSAAVERPGVLRRHPLAFGLASAAMVLAALMVSLWPAASQSYSTAPGEQRTIALADGSHVTLNTRSRLSVRLTHAARDVVLENGEAYFEVAEDPARAFTVRTALGTARALGTRFDVFLGDRDLLVTTAQGRVEVRTPAAQHGVLVEGGQRVELRPGSTTPLLTRADLGATLGWLNRRLEVDNAPLAEVLRDFSRYTDVPVRAQTPAVGSLRVTAVLRTGDLDSLQATLHGAFGLDIERGDREWLVVDPRVRLPAGE